jgi:hypothetical protein
MVPHMKKKIQDKINEEVAVEVEKEETRVKKMY